MARILGFLLALVFFLVSHVASAQDSELLERAQVGDDDAQLAIGHLYLKEGGAQRDVAKAEMWYRKAAENGNAEAQMALGKLYYEGLGVPQNHAEAVQWWKKAAALGNEQAPAFLAAAYLTGRGVEQDYRSAHMWFSILSVGDYRSDYGSHASHSIEVLMTPEEIIEANAMLIQCEDQKYRDC